MKRFKTTLAALLALCLLVSMFPVYAADAGAASRSVQNVILIDDDAEGGYAGDYVVIYNPATSASTSYSTGTMTGLIETAVGANTSAALPQTDPRAGMYRIDVDGKLNERFRAEDPNYGVIAQSEPTRATSYNVGDTRDFTILAYNPGSGTTLNFKVLAKGEHCYVWTPSQNKTNYYTLDSINTDYAQLAADEFDRMYDLMNTSFGSHSNGANGDGRVSLLFYNIDDGWSGGGFVAGYFAGASYSYDNMPIINIDTYPAIYYTYNDVEYSSMDTALSTACHEYQHCINYSNTSSMSTWLNECFSAAAEEICYPGSSIVSRIASWENHTYTNDWLDPPEEFAYTPDFDLHKGYSMYSWGDSLEMDDTLALYAQVSFFAQYLYTRFGNGIYRQISSHFSSGEPSAITAATGVNCSDLVRDFRVAVTANAAQDQYGGVYGFVPQTGYDPANYYNVQNPYDLLAPVVFTGASCSIQGGGAITVKPVNGVYNPPSGANANLKYIGVTLRPFTLTAVSNNTSYGTISVNGKIITASPAEGYYVESCTLLSGAATWTISGNTITVAADADCSLQVNFAPKPTCTVSFLASGHAQGSQSALIYDVITLPDAVSVSAEGWTFVGWTDHQTDKTADAPACYAPGAAYTVTGNAALYALFTRVETGGPTVYELLTSAPADWAGNYVVTNTAGTYVLKGMTGSANGTDAENSGNSAAFASTGITQDGSTLGGVPNDYVMTLTASGSGYTLRSAGTGCYYGMNSSSYLCAYSAVNANYCDWTPAINGSGVVSLKNAANGSYPYLSWNGSNNYFWSNGSSYAYVLKLYRENDGAVTYYWTDPVPAQHIHEMVYHAAVTPGCTTAGSSAYYQCADCGRYFTDAAGENEIALDDTVVAPLGHNYVGVVTDPTPTQAGYTTYTCSRCGDSYTDDFTLPLGEDFLVHFSVPYGVTKPADLVSNTNTGVTLPVVEAPVGYRFLGWVLGDYDYVETRPAAILTGSYVAPEEVTLKALFSYADPQDEGGIVYRLADSLEDGGRYLLVDSGSVSGSTGMAVGNSAAADSHYLNAVSVTLSENNSLASAEDVSGILWQAAAISGGFGFYNAAAGKYMGLDAGGYLYPSDAPVAWAYTAAKALDNQIDSQGYYYLSFDGDNSRYTTSKSGSEVWLYQQTDLKTCLYTTELRTFIDVLRGDYFNQAVFWAFYHEPQITAGTTATTFSPNRSCTRAQAVTFLWNALGRPEATQTPGFTDVPEGAYYAQAVAWAAERGVTAGTSAATFSPNEFCTRAQILTFLWNALGQPEPQDGAIPFGDVPADAYYAQAVAWAVENGVTSGTSADTFSPNAPCTRAQTVTFLYKAQLLPNE